MRTSSLLLGIFQLIDIPVELLIPIHIRISFYAQSRQGQQLTTVAGSFCCPTKDKPNRYDYQPNRTTSNWICTTRDFHDNSNHYAVRNIDRSGR